MNKPTLSATLRTIAVFVVSVCQFGGVLWADDDETMSLNSEVMVLPAPGEVVIDGKTDDWDLSAGVWSYNAPDVVDAHSIWTHLMWDDRGIYYLACIHDTAPMQNATKGVDFDRSWQGDSVQLRTIFDDKTDDEHQMHINFFHSTPDDQSYMIVKHGGFKNKPPYDATGPDRPDLLERFGATMESAGGQIAFAPWDDGKGYNIESFMPWSYLRLSGEPLKAGDSFVFGWETMWAKPAPEGAEVELGQYHRLADGVKNAKANRIFMFRARNDWGQATLTDANNLKITEQQQRLQQQRLRAFEDLSTRGSIPITYQLPEGEVDREVTIAIEDANGKRVRNLFGQYPRSGGEVTDFWDGLNDAGEPVAPGRYTAIIVDHEPLELELLTSLYNAGTPPWRTTEKYAIWGSDHGAATSVVTRGDRVIVGFAIPEAGVGLSCFNVKTGMEWSIRNSASDLTADEQFLYSFEFNFWNDQFVVSRLDITSGNVVPFVKENGEQMTGLIMTMSAGESEDGAVARAHRVTIARGADALWLNIPEDAIYKIHPLTGEILEKRPNGNIRTVRDQDSELYVLTNEGVIRRMAEDFELGDAVLKLTGIKAPGRFGISPDKQRIAVIDTETNQVFVFNVEGGRPVVIGKPMAGDDRPAGPFDRDDVMLPAAVAFDANGQIWVPEGTSHVHRTSVWTPDGKLADEFWGQPPYANTHGRYFTHDATRFIATNIEFKLDFDIDLKNRKSEEQALMYHPGLGNGGVVREYTDAQGRTHEFSINVPGNIGESAIVIHRRGENGVFVPAAGLFKPTTSPWRSSKEFLEVLPKSDKPVGWVDHNGNTKVDSNELYTENVQYKAVYWSSGWVRPDMTIFSNTMHTYALQEINKHGVPVYHFSKPQAVPNPVVTVNRQSSTGSPIMDDAGNITDGITYHTIDGRQGSYPNLYGRHSAPAAQRGLLIAPFRTNGVVEGVPGVGSITALQGDRGEWFVMSFDGLFISSLFQDIKGHVAMDETLIGGESFGGHLWRVQGDGPLAGKILLQSGSNSYRIHEVKNLETTRRQTLSLNVTAEQIQDGQRIAASKKSAASEGPLVLSRVDALPQAAPDPDLARDAALVADHPFTLVSEQNDPSRWFKVSLLSDGAELALMYQVADDSPWKNASDRFTHAFIGGDAVDLKLLSPAHGAIRLLAAPLNHQPQLIYWRKQADVKENPQHYVVANNLENARTFDVVKVLDNARVSVKTSDNGYGVLVRVPLKEIGLDPLPEQIQGLAGVIYSDPAGSNRQTRLYWHDKATTMVNDVPTESDVNPERFGTIAVQPVK